MFEFAAAQLQQEERERRIADGLRRRELLDYAAGGQGGDGSPARQATTRRSAVMPVRPAAARAHAER